MLGTALRMPSVVLVIGRRRPWIAIAAGCASARSRLCSPATTAAPRARRVSPPQTRQRPPCGRATSCRQPAIAPSIPCTSSSGTTQRWPLATQRRPTTTSAAPGPICRRASTPPRRFHGSGTRCHDSCSRSALYTQLTAVGTVVWDFGLPLPYSESRSEPPL